MDSNAVPPTAPESVPKPLPTTARVSAPKPRKGKGSQQKSELKFRQKKNDEFQAELQASILRRLKVSDPTNVNALSLQSAIVPARVPVSFCGLPTFVEELWARMKAIGTRPFSILATDQNYAIFLKCVLYIAEAKLCFAQMKCETVPPFPLPTATSFTEMQLRTLNMLARRLPFPLVIFMEAIGNFMADKQPVVPVLIKATPAAASGAINFAPTDIGIVLKTLLRPCPADDVVYTIGQRMRGLPNIEWVEGLTAEQVRVFSVTEVSYRFWSHPPSPAERLVFEQIIASMESKKGFLLQTDITTGVGSIIQCVRFPDTFDPDEDETLYYMNTMVPDFEEKLATALSLGYEYQGDAFSRYCSSYAECLKHGSACAPDARHAVIWADN